jgi:hypothetical protein
MVLRIEESAACARQHDSRGDSHGQTHGRAGEGRFQTAGHWFGRIMSYSAESVNGCLSVSDIMSGRRPGCPPGLAFLDTYVLAAAVLLRRREEEGRQMEMLLMGVCLSVLGMAVVCLAFGAATRDLGNPPVAAPGVEKEMVRAAASPARFFVDPPALPMAAHAGVPIEALLLQIENHVRLEHAAAECFLQSPSASLLHSRTISAFVN